MNDLDYFKAAFGLRDKDVLLVPFGSRVYGTHTEASDYDYIAIIPAGRRAQSGQEYRRGQVNVQVCNRHEFQKDLDWHQVHAVEAYFLLDDEARGDFSFRLDRRRLRAEFQRKSSHSYVRAKKKFLAEGDPVLGRKSLFHALRILQFGTQVATRGRIVDWAAANGWWWEIRARTETEWEPYHERYRPVHSDLASQFRRATAVGG